MRNDVPAMISDQPAYRSAGSRILLVDDEPRIRDFVSRALYAADYAIDFASDGTSALEQVAGSGGYGLVILDLIMPDMDGRAVLTEILRRHPEQAILVLSCLEDVAIKVACLELGAQDYLTKPFSLAELLARVRARLRGDGHQSEMIRAGGLVLDVGRLQANIGAGPVLLTRLEFLLLRELMEHPGRSVSKGQLLASVWGFEFDPGSNVVDVCVRRLRSKLGFELIKTVRGEGYQLAAS